MFDPSHPALCPLMNSLHDGLIVAKDNAIIFINEAALRTLETDNAIGGNINEMFGGLKKASETPDTWVAGEVRKRVLNPATGIDRVIKVPINILWHTLPRDHGVLLALQDQSELNAMKTRVVEADKKILRDGTGLLNRLGFDEEMRGIFARPQHPDQSLCSAYMVIRVHMDGVDGVAYNEALHDISARLRGSVRDNDRVAHEKEGVFLAYLSNVQNNVTHSVATRIVKSMATPFFLGGKLVFPAVVAGIAVRNLDGTHFDELDAKARKIADEADVVTAAIFYNKERQREILDYEDAVKQTLQSIQNRALPISVRRFEGRLDGSLAFVVAPVAPGNIMKDFWSIMNTHEMTDQAIKLLLEAVKPLPARGTDIAIIDCPEYCVKLLGDHITIAFLKENMRRRFATFHPDPAGRLEHAAWLGIAAPTALHHQGVGHLLVSSETANLARNADAAGVLQAEMALTEKYFNLMVEIDE